MLTDYFRKLENFEEYFSIMLGKIFWLNVLLTKTSQVYYIEGSVSTFLDKRLHINPDVADSTFTAFPIVNSANLKS